MLWAWDNKPYANNMQVNAKGDTKILNPSTNRWEDEKISFNEAFEGILKSGTVKYFVAEIVH